MINAILNWFLERWGLDAFTLVVIGWLVWNMIILRWSIFGNPSLRRYDHLQDGSILHRLDRIEEKLDELNRER